ncbi:MAG TPA: hypothetical protein VK666_11330 [Chryseolinea sp.]|nr:hypothetical protein [Chryseolinea sp.]
MPSPTTTHQRSRTWLFLLATGLLVGTLDILAAFTNYYINTGKGPEGVLRYIASGLFGEQAFSGAGTMMLWGLFCHFIIAFACTIVFYVLYPRFIFFIRFPILSSLLYSVLIWLITTRVIMPLSNVPQSGKPPDFLQALKSIAILFFMISLPLSLLMKRHFRVVKKGL